MPVSIRPPGPRRRRARGDDAPERRWSQSGQGMVEYALILIMVSVVAIFVILAMGPELQGMFSNVVAGFNT